MTRRTMKGAANVAADARQMLARARKHVRAFEKADAGRRRKVLTAHWLGRFERSIQALEHAIGAQSAGRAAVVRATRSEAELRQELFDAIATLRDRVKLAFPGDRALAQAFGVGQRLNVKVTPALIATALALEQAYALPEHSATVVAAVSPREIARLRQLRQSLATADTVQNTRLSARKGATVAKIALTHEVRRSAAHVRMAARLVFRRDPRILAEFRSTIPRRARGSHAGSSPGGPGPGAAASSG